MIRKISRVFLVVLLAALGWFLGYLKAPHFEDTKMFWIGFAACMFLVACVLILDFLYNSKAFNTSRKSRFLLGLLSVLVLLAASLPGIMTSRIDSKLRSQLETEQERRKMEEAKHISSLMTGYMEGLGTLLARVDRDLSASNIRSLSDTTIDLVVAFNDQLSPYHIVTKDSITKARYSPEKGQLLLQLAHRRMDSLSFAKIKSRTSFSSTYLPNANLDSTDLSGIDLSKSFMPYCSFISSVLDFANLSDVYLKGGDLISVTMHESYTNRSDISHSDFTNSTIHQARLNGCNLSYSQFYGSNMTQCVVNHSLLVGAILKNCILVGTDFAVSDLSRVNLSHSNLESGRIVETSLNGATLLKLRLDSVEVSTNWGDIVQTIDACGIDDIKVNYQILKDNRTGRSYLSPY